MSEKLNIGQIITDEQAKDAIHIAVAPVVAGENLDPGSKVQLDGQGRAVLGSGPGYVGVVDPFLSEWVEKGERFWLFMVPYSITSLRHDWSHPAFAAQSVPVESVSVDTTESIKWLRKFAKQVGRDYGGLVAMAEEIVEHGGAYVGDEDSKDSFDGTKDDFLKHLAIVTGKTFKTDDVYFRCAC